MPLKSARLALLVGIFTMLRPQPGGAQEFFAQYATATTAGGISLEETMAQELNGPNFSIGPIRFSCAAGVGIEFNDNVGFSQNERQSDFIIRPSLALDGSMPLSGRHLLRFSLSLAYGKYLSRSQNDTDGVFVVPGTGLEWTIPLGETLTIALHERPSYQEEIFGVPVLSNVAQYGRWENRAGLELQWDPRESTRVNLGYDHYDLWAKAALFKSQDRSIDTVFVRPSYQLDPKVRLGLEASYSSINFHRAERPDGSSFLAGPFLQWQLSDTVALFVGGGLQSTSFAGSYRAEVLAKRFVKDRHFDKPPEDFLRAAELDSDTETNSYYARCELTHSPSESFRHRLSGSKNSEVGFFTNYYDIYHVKYAIDWKPLSKTEISPSVFGEHYKTSGGMAEEACRVGATVEVIHYLTNSVTLALNGRFVLKNSNYAGFDYRQNLALLSLYYKF